MADVAEKLMTVTEFLRWHDGTDRRHELVGGRPVMMAPSSRIHGVLAIAIGAELRTQLAPPCVPRVRPGSCSKTTTSAISLPMAR